MPRGRHQYYDPILQVPSMAEGAQNLERIELFPVGQESTSRLPEQIGKWVARRIGADGRVLEESPGNFQHDAALAEAQQLWPGLEVFELNAEIEDSTWEGVGPSPRLWQTMNDGGGVYLPPLQEMADLARTEEDPAVKFVEDRKRALGMDYLPPVSPEDARAILEAAPTLHAIQVTGTYVRVEDLLVLLEGYAVEYDNGGNPSAALGLREVAQMIRESF